jgi:hypothetical protein
MLWNGMSITRFLLVIPLGLSGCSQSDEDLCKDVQEKLTKCGTIGPSRCPDVLDDSVREQYECIMGVECQDIGRECAID